MAREKILEDNPDLPTKELRHLCSKAQQRAQDMDVFSLAWALEARLVDEMSKDWGWPKMDRSKDVSQTPPRYKDLQGLYDLIQDVEERYRGKNEVALICDELAKRVESELGTPPEEPLSLGEDEVIVEEIEGETLSQRRRRQKRESARRRREREKSV